MRGHEVSGSETGSVGALFGELVRWLLPSVGYVSSVLFIACSSFGTVSRFVGSEFPGIGFYVAGRAWAKVSMIRSDSVRAMDRSGGRVSRCFGRG